MNHVVVIHPATRGMMDQLDDFLWYQ